VLQRKLLDLSLGFAAGVMIAASYWSLLAPAIEMASKSKIYGVDGEYAFVPVGIGFLVGAAFVYGTDALISSLGIQSPNVLLAMQSVGMNKQRLAREAKIKADWQEARMRFDGVSNSYSQVESTTIDGTQQTYCHLHAKVYLHLTESFSPRQFLLFSLSLSLSLSIYLYLFISLFIKKL
jgi:zinc transporter ZupT